MLMKQKVIAANSVDRLNRQMDELLNDGWIPVGAHKVVPRYVPSPQGKTTYTVCEYSQTMILKEVKRKPAA